MVLPISDLFKARVVRGNSYHQRRIKDALGFLTSATATLTEQCSAHREIQRSLKKLLRSYRHGIEYRFNNGVNIINGVSQHDPVISMQDIAKAQSVTGSGFHQSNIQHFRALLMQSISFVEECNAHREIQKSMRYLDPQYRPGFMYHFNNAVVHNSWAFPRHLYPPIEGFGWGPRKTNLIWQYHALPKEPNFHRAGHFHTTPSAIHSATTSTTTFTSQQFQPRAQTQAQVVQQFSSVPLFHVRANINVQQSHMHAQHSSTPYVPVRAPSITRGPFQLVQYLPQHTPQPPHNNPQQNLHSLQQLPQQCVLQPPRLILREPQQRVQLREPQLDPRRHFERQNNGDNRREQLREDHQRRQGEARLENQHRRRNY